jgi:predicted PurR-regulated permease PerM
MSDRDFTRRMLQTVATVAGAGLLVALLWAARDALMIIYVSALIAMGMSPLVKLIERPPKAGTRRVPRWLAILAIYLVVVSAFVFLGLLVIPPLVAQASTLWEKLPGEFNRFQQFLISHGLMVHEITLEQAVQNAPTGSGSNAVGTVLVAISGVIGGIFGLITILILTFYLLLEAGAMFEYLVRFVPLGRRGDVALAARQGVAKVSAWLRAQFILAGDGHVCRGWTRADERALLLRDCAHRRGRNDSRAGPSSAGSWRGGPSPFRQARAVVGIYFLVLHQLEANILVRDLERSVGVSPVPS